MPPWTVACHTLLSMGFSRQEYWTGLLFPSPEDLPDPGIEPGSPVLQVDSLTTELSGEPESNYLDSATNLQEYEGQRNMMNHTTSTQLAKSRQVRCSGFFTDIL